ncbi:uncharacterized protein LOC124157754 isoform X2 [Ischnura elegans]|uniref:uncharacterized protein LOC124157754 isoform X2 n=1 Tax=Ischnura elegans TaxID=197161 RepID=UPI001ED8B112|nr:uncharacterized protein LOC124157754 isoform X2 [Ischnura elegans]
MKMDRRNPPSATNCAASPDRARINMNGSQLETLQSLNKTILFNTLDGQCKMNEVDNMMLHVSDSDKTLNKTEEEHHTCKNKSENYSSPMLNEEFDCGRISPIQAEDVHPINDDFHNSAMGLEKNKETEIIEFRQETGPHQGPSCSSGLLDNHSSYNILGQYHKFAFQGADQCSNRKESILCSYKVDSDDKISIPTTHKDHKNSAEDICKIASQNAVKRPTQFSYGVSIFDKNISNLELMESHSMLRHVKNSRETEMTDPDRETKSRLGIISDKECKPSVIGEGMLYFGGSEPLERNFLAGVSWKTGKEISTLGENLMPYHSPTVQSIADNLHQRWLKNVKKVNLPNESAYEKQLENQGTESVPILMNNLRKSGCPDLQRSLPHHTHSSPVAKEDKYLCKMEKGVEERVCTRESSQVGRMSTMEILPNRESMESDQKGNCSGLDNGKKAEQIGHCYNMVETTNFNQEMNDKVSDGIKAVEELNVLGEKAMEKSIPLNYFRKMENVAMEVPCIHSKAGKQQFVKENHNEIKSDGQFPPIQYNSDILSGKDCGEEMENVSKILEKNEAGAAEPPKIYLKDDIDMDVSMKDNDLKNEIESLVDGIMAKKEAELFAIECSFMKRSDETFEKNYEEHRGEPEDMAARVNSNEEVVKKIGPVLIHLGMKDHEGEEKSSKEKEVRHQGILERSDEVSSGEKTEMGGILVVNQPRKSNCERIELSMGSQRDEHSEESPGKSSNVNMREPNKDVEAYQFENMEILVGQVNEQLLSDEEMKAQVWEEIDRKSLNIPLSSGENYCSNELKATFVSVLPENANDMCVKKDTVTSASMKQKEAYLGECIGVIDTENSIPENTKTPYVVMILADKGPSKNFIETVSGDKDTLDKTVLPDTYSLQRLVPKKVEINTNRCGAEVFEAIGNEFSTKTATGPNDEEDNRNHLPVHDVERVAPVKEKIVLMQKESRFNETQFISEKGEIISEMAGVDKCSVDNTSNFNAEGFKITGHENCIDNQKSDAHINDNNDGEVIETKNMGGDANSSLSKSQVSSHGVDTLKPNMENKIPGEKDGVMLMSSSVNFDCVKNDVKFCNENLENNRKESVRSQAVNEICREFDCGKSILMDELQVEECNEKLGQTTSINRQPDELPVQISCAKENNFGEEKEINNDTFSLNRSQEVKSALSQYYHDDGKVSGKNDAENELIVPLNLYANEFSRNDTLGSDKMDINGVQKMNVDHEGSWFSPQKKKDYLISGIELIRDYSVDDSQFLEDPNGIELSLEGDRAEDDVREEIQNIEENLKPTPCFMSPEFSVAGKFLHAQPTCLILEEVNGDDDNLNHASASELCFNAKYENVESDDIIRNQSTFGPLSSPQDVKLLSESPVMSFSDASNFECDEDHITGSGENSGSSPSSAFYNKGNFISHPLNGPNHDKFDCVDCSPKQNGFGSLNAIQDKGNAISLTKDTYAEEDKAEYGTKNEGDNANFVHENGSLRNSHPQELDIHPVKKYTADNLSDAVTKSFVNFERKLIDDEDHQVVPDGTEEIPVEGDQMPTKDEISLVKSKTAESDTNGMIKNSGISDGSTFSLDMYIENVLDKHLPPENKSYCECSQFVDTGCQTQLCGLLNIIHSCDCLASTLLPVSNLEHSKFSGRKRELQALNLETLVPKKKKMKPFSEDITNEILINDIFPKCDDDLGKKHIFNHKKQSSYLCIENDSVAENVVENIGLETSSKNVAQLAKISSENDWEEVCDAYDGVGKKEHVDQKVPHVEVLHTERAPESSGSIQDIDPECLSSYPKKNYGVSKILRLGLSKRAKLPRLHQKN